MSENKNTTRKASKPIKVGDRFGRLVVIGDPFVVSAATISHPYRKDKKFPCRCDCGQECAPIDYNLRSGGSQSCGCLKRERATQALVARNFRHGGTCNGVHLPEYNSWHDMMRRCYDKKCKGYPNYGGRGITVCKRWRDSFLAFHADMGNRPSPKHSLDRINNESGYKPSNCQWATREQQNENRRSSVMLAHNGQRMLIKHWSQATGIGKSTLSWRIRNGWSAADALTQHPKHNRKSKHE